MTMDYDDGSVFYPATSSSGGNRKVWRGRFFRWRVHDFGRGFGRETEVPNGVQGGAPVRGLGTSSPEAEACSLHYTLILFCFEHNVTSFWGVRYSIGGVWSGGLEWARISRAQEREPITGVWGPGAKPLVRGSGGRSPLKMTTVLLYNK